MFWATELQNMKPVITAERTLTRREIPTGQNSDDQNSPSSEDGDKSASRPRKRIIRPRSEALLGQQGFRENNK